MAENNILNLFDDYIVTPGFKRSDITEWFKQKKSQEKRGVYGIISNRLEVLYVGSSIDLPNRVPHHLYQDKLIDHFDKVLLIGIKYIKGDATGLERKYIRDLKPKLNRYRYDYQS
jgi:excinuclease UvrABC nuclease subunit